MKIYKHLFTVLIGVSLSILASVSYAQTPEQKAKSIIASMQAATRGYGDSKVNMNMKLINKKGKVSTRSFTIKTLEGKNNSQKVSLVFSAPSNLKGTALLIHAYTTKPSQQWMYLPKSKRIKKISSGSGSFLGSEFSFEDLGGFDVRSYKSKWVKSSKVNGQPCDVIENRPKGKSGYSKVVSCISKSNKMPLEVNFYDKKGRHLKTLTNTQHRKYKGKYWLSHSMKMKNHITGKATHLSILSAKIGVGLKSSDFTQESLKR